MCGIAGAWQVEGLVSRVGVGAMADAIRHRGPDDEGTWFSADGAVGFGHRRLAIIDLTSAARQPMSNHDAGVTIVFNGEIYNYAELKVQLEGLGHRFRSHSDTEVILRAYEQWGSGCVERFRGMFAFALFDAPRRRLVLARDHVGIKPLYYYWDGRTFAFASEIKAIWALGGLDRSIDRSAIFDYLTYLYIPAPKTAYAAVRKLEAGKVLTFDGQALLLRGYWDLTLDEDAALDERAAVALVRERLADAVRLSTVSDVPLGVFLSGGLDSSTVLAEMAALTAEPIETFSIGFDVAEHSETDYAREVADHFRTRHHERIVGRDAMGDLLEKLVWLYDEPFGDGSAIPTFRLAQFARERVKVVLSGDGGDEVFAGYRWYDAWLRQDDLNRRTPSLLRNAVLSPLGRAWPRRMRGTGIKRLLEGFGDGPLESYGRLMELFSPSEKRRVLGPSWANEFAGYDDYWYFRQYWRADLDPITRLQYVDLKTYLPDDILTKVDRTSMAVGLEVRPPFLDPLLIEAVFRMPAAIRFKARTKKHLLREAMRDVLPSTVLTREKKGFSSPLWQWVAEERGWIEARIHANPVIVQRRALTGLDRLNWGAKCWALLILEQWAGQASAAGLMGSR